MTVRWPVKPALAEIIWDISKDGISYTFYLRKGVYFHDDDCFPNGKDKIMRAKAQDVKYCFDRLCFHNKQIIRILDF